MQTHPLTPILERTGAAYSIIECEPDRADTAAFCAHYGYSPAESANLLVIRGKTGEQKYAACLVLASCRLDVNKVARKKLGSRRVSFASPEQTLELTGMALGGVTPIGLPDTLPLWIDAAIMALDRVVLGGGDRHSKIIATPALLTALPNAEVVDALGKPIPAAPDGAR
ncbi:MAG: YbaK/EbsC family protein [Pseudomonadota bacterium]